MTSEEYDKARKLPTWNYNVIVASPVALNLCKIHPLKQVLVNDICIAAKREYFVKRIIVFGSAIRWDTHQWSDLDICIDWRCNPRDKEYVDIPEVARFKNKVSIISKGNVDIIDYQFLNETVVEDSVRKGVVVYE